MAAPSTPPKKSINRGALYRVGEVYEGDDNQAVWLLELKNVEQYARAKAGSLRGRNERDPLSIYIKCVCPQNYQMWKRIREKR